MKKLGKNLNFVKETVEAYACSSTCGNCGGNTTANVITYRGVYQAYLDSFGK